MNEKNRATAGGIFLAVLAAALYAINAPCSKILLDYMPSTLMAGFLYLGAGLGMAPVALIRKLKKGAPQEAKLTRAELPYTVAMILLDIAAPICLLFGLKTTSAASASLLNNFEIVATAIISLAIFREKISPRLWCGILFVTLACILLSVEDFSQLQFSYGSLFILLACVCWGFENNCTRKISSKDPLQIDRVHVHVKLFQSGQLRLAAPDGNAAPPPQVVGGKNRELPAGPLQIAPDPAAVAAGHLNDGLAAGLLELDAKAQRSGLEAGGLHIGDVDAVNLAVQEGGGLHLLGEVIALGGRHFCGDAKFAAFQCFL